MICRIFIFSPQIFWQSKVLENPCYYIFFYLLFIYLLFDFLCILYNFSVKQSNNKKIWNASPKQTNKKISVLFNYFNSKNVSNQLLDFKHDLQHSKWLWQKGVTFLSVWQDNILDRAAKENQKKKRFCDLSSDNIIALSIVGEKYL